MDIKKIREKLKMTQVEFAKGIGVSVMSIKRWESGANPPSPLARRALEEVYKIKEEDDAKMPKM